MSRIKLLLVGCICLVAGSSCANQNGTKQNKTDHITVGKIPKIEDAPANTGAGVLLRSAKAYAQLKSYTGTISTRSTTTHSKLIGADIITSKITFKAPRKLRVDATTKRQGNTYSIVSDGKNHSIVSPIARSPSGVDRSDRIEEILLAYQGVLRGVTIGLPAIIIAANFDLENIGVPKGQLLPAFASKAELVGEEKIDGHMCHRVVCERVTETWTLWIDKELYLIRRLDKDSSKEQMRAQRAAGAGGTSGRINETHLREEYSIDSINGDIPDETFRVRK